MRKLFLPLLALAGGAYAQDIAGTWQGTLSIPQANRELRTVMKISRDSGVLKGTMFSIDQGGQPIPVNQITQQGANVKLQIPAIGGSYEGKFEADGNTIKGKFSQGPQPIDLVLTRATAQTAWAIPEPPPPPKPMAADAKLEFEVATFKPSKPDQPGKAITVRGGQFVTINTTLTDLLTFAYGLHAKQLVNAPDWLANEKYDINAKPGAEGQPTPAQLKAMILKLIEDRCALKTHRETKELSVYAITLAKTGPKLTKSSSQSSLPGLFFRGPGVLPVTNAKISELANALQGVVLDRPVVDQTGLTDRYDFTLNWTPDEFQFQGAPKLPPPPNNNGGSAPPDLFTAMQEQLGLKLESTKAPAEVIVIDRISKPSDN